MDQVEKFDALSHLVGAVLALAAAVALVMLAARRETLAVLARQGRKQTIGGRGRLGGRHAHPPGPGETRQAAHG